MAKKRIRETPAVRKEMILSQALVMAEKYGYSTITREIVADSAGVSCGLVNKYFVTMAQLRRAVLKAAIEREILPIIAQGVTLRDPLTSKLGSTLKMKIRALFD